MNTSLHWLLAAVVMATFFAGSASAPVPAVPPLPRFEYLCQPKMGRPWEQVDLEKMNELGARGWELVQQLAVPNNDVFCFKRQLR